MATIKHSHHEIHFTKRSPAQKVSLSFGFIFLALSIIGTLVPTAFGLHLRLIQTAVYLLTGIMAIIVGASNEPQKASFFCVGAGLFYAILGIAGFVIGVPAISVLSPELGADQYLFNVIPGYAELGTYDHYFHLVAAVFLLFGASPTRRKITIRTEKITKE